MPGGLNKIWPHRKDYSLLHTFGAILPDPQGLPDSFSIYDGRDIPNQNAIDRRFTPPVRTLPYGCTGETGAFIGGIENGTLYRPDDLYDNTPPRKDGTGRDIRDSMKVMKNYGLLSSTGSRDTFGDYYNVYGSDAIDDYDAVRIALWINQNEKRAVSVGSWWYWGSIFVSAGSLPIPSFNTSKAVLHNYAITGWDKEYGLEVIPWCGMDVGKRGRVYMSREIFNALMAQPYTGAFTIARTPSTGALPIGWQAIVDHLVYFIRNLFRV